MMFQPAGTQLSISIREQEAGSVRDGNQTLSPITRLTPGPSKLLRGLLVYVLFSTDVWKNLSVRAFELTLVQHKTCVN